MTLWDVRSVTMMGQVLFIVVVLFGHLALWIGMFNRTHALNIPGHWVRVTELTQVSGAVAILVFLARHLSADGTFHQSVWQTLADSGGLALYAGVAAIFAVWTAVEWFHRRWFVERPVQLIANDTERLDLAKQLGRMPALGWSARLFAVLPMNQMFDLYVNTKTLQVPRLAAELDGLTITHLSDLHFTGKIARPFFDAVIDRALALNGDLIAITGDILEAEECYEWLAPTLGRLKAPLGVYFVLGNHDKRLRDVGRLRNELKALGLVDLGSAAYQIGEAGRALFLAGNERPWFESSVEIPARRWQEPLRILLAHSPDQIEWARRRDFDLMLAGHTHGGHFQLPWIGPIACPSRYGVKFAAGVFYEHPTLLHVSRGISGLDPLRFNCPPELTKLVLRIPTV